MARKKSEQRIRSTRTRKEQIHDKCKGICAHCGRPISIGEDFSLEHVIPLAKGGTNDYSNMVALCRECNKEKGDDIVSADYYSYAPPLVYEEIENILDSYYKENDWLTQDTLFKQDRFFVPITQTIQLKNGKIYTKDSQCEIKKLRGNDAKEFFNKYVNSFKKAIEEDIESVFGGREYDDNLSPKLYQISFKGKPICAFNYVLTPGNGKGLELEGRGALDLFLMINPDINNWGPSTKCAIYDCLRGIMRKFTESLEDGKTKGLLFFRINVPAMDKKGHELVEMISKVWRQEGLERLVTDDDEERALVYRTTSVIRVGIDVELEDGMITRDEFIKKEKLYSGQLRRRLSKNKKEEL